MNQSFRKLEGIVVGTTWGDDSKDMFSLIKVLAETQLAAKTRALWSDISNKERSVITTQKVHGNSIK